MSRPRATRYRACAAIFSALLVLLPGARAASAATVTVYDLTANWSDKHNPNGPWMYRQGASALPADGDWTPVSTTFPEYNPASGHVPQPAWAPGNQTGTFLPPWFRSAVTVTSNSADWNAKDVVVHSTDHFNGGSSGPASVIWTCPAAGTAVVSGRVWNARDLGRNQTWQVLVNGVVQKSGGLPGDGTIQRAHPTKFKLPPKRLSVGDTVELLVVEDSSDGAGDFVGTNLRIALTH